MPRRTKACAICRQKRIRCDATMPHCLMCEKFGRQCPGPTEAPLMFVDTSFYPLGKKPRKRSSPQKKASLEGSKMLAVQKVQARPELYVSNANEPVVLALQVQEVATCKGNDAGPTTEQSRSSDPLDALQAEYAQHYPEEATNLIVGMSARHINQEGFFANLTSYLCAEGRHVPGAIRRTPTWLHTLRHVAVAPCPTAQTAEGANALSLALRATAAAFTGLESRNTALIEYASGLYGSALQSQRRVVSIRGDPKAVGAEMIGASIMLSMFEAMVATTRLGYASHVLGAAKLLDGLIRNTTAKKAHGFIPRYTPEGIQSDLGPGVMLTNIYFHIRHQLVFVLFTSPFPCVQQDAVMKSVLLDTEGWTHTKLPVNQKILRPLSRLAGLLPEMAPSEGNAQARNEAGDQAREETEELWIKFNQESQGSRLYWHDEQTGRTDFRDPFSALNYAYFAACWLMLEVHQLSLSSEGGASETHWSVPSASTLSSSASDISSLAPSSRALRSTPSRASTPSLASTTLTAPASASDIPSPPFDAFQRSLISSSTENPTATLPLSASAAAASYAALILNVAWYLRIRDVGFSYLRLHIPLFLVAKHAPKPEQRRVARMVFEEWRQGSLRGIGVLALEALDAGEAPGKGC